MKKKQFTEDQEKIFEDAIIEKRNGYWQFRMWLPTEKKYARESLKTGNRATAIEKAKRKYLDLHANLQQGKAYFSLTVKEGVALYIEHRRHDIPVSLGEGRLRTIKTHLEHWIRFSENNKLKDLEIDDGLKYLGWRANDHNSPASPSTILNEQATINACMKFLFRKGHVSFDMFEFRKIDRNMIDNESIRRSTFTDEEYDRIERAFKTYCAKSNKSIDADERMERAIMRSYFMISANSGMRVGEQRQLRWSDVSIERKVIRGDVRVLARISVRKETTKVKKPRMFLCRGGGYFETLKELYGETEKDGLVFTLDGEKEISERKMLKHFYAVMKLAQVENVEERKIVPYSFRHYCITQRIRSDVSLKNVAEMHGTSIAQIEKTYYHLNDATRLTTATADHVVLEDGTIRSF